MNRQIYIYTVYTHFMMKEIYLNVLGSVDCSDNRFRCANGQCIMFWKRCDSNFDCLDDTDEEKCGMLCKTGIFPQNVDLVLICKILNISV